MKIGVRIVGQPMVSEQLRPGDLVIGSSGYMWVTRGAITGMANVRGYRALFLRNDGDVYYFLNEFGEILSTFAHHYSVPHWIIL